MAKNSNGRYSKEFRTEALKMVVEDGVSAYEASRRLS
jgi:transposase